MQKRRENPSLDFGRTLNNLHRRWKKNRKLEQTFFFLTLSSELHLFAGTCEYTTEEWENKQQRCEKSLMWKSILTEKKNLSI